MLWRNKEEEEFYKSQYPILDEIKNWYSLGGHFLGCVSMESIYNHEEEDKFLVKLRVLYITNHIPKLYLRVNRSYSYIEEELCYCDKDSNEIWNLIREKLPGLKVRVYEKWRKDRENFDQTLREKDNERK